jgi:sterol desaturase/sphingolipid hydroxylase (fatty acid hydroxylase superfamily)
MGGSDILDFIIWVAIAFPILMVVYFLLPCGSLYYFFYVRNFEKLKQRKIYSNLPSKEDVWREIRYSTATIFVYTIGLVWLKNLLLNGQTRVYYDLNDYPIWYLFVSFFIFMIIHDAYLYWMHRLMHIKLLFRRVHFAHHQSLYPTPFAVFASTPYEAIINFAIIPVLLVLIPFNFWMLLVYFSYNLITNLTGHLGFELFPSGLLKAPLLKYSGSSTSHQIHHVRFNKNYGGYFNFWDRIMGTYL